MKIEQSIQIRAHLVQIEFESTKLVRQKTLIGSNICRCKLNGLVARQILRSRSLGFSRFSYFCYSCFDWILVFGRI